MSKIQKFNLVLLSVFFALVINLFFGRLIVAKISTWPILNKLNLISPQAPIVITNKQEIRVSDSGDILQAVDDIKSKLSSVVIQDGNQFTLLGGAINLTSDGVFLTSASIFNKSAATYFVVLNDGRVAKIIQKTADPATGAVFFKADINSVPVSPLGNSSSLSPGEKILLVANSPQGQNNKVQVSFISFAQADIQKRLFYSDKPSRSFGIQPVGDLLGGQAIVNLKGEVVGLWINNEILSSDVIRQTTGLYFGNSGQITRPSFAFSYNLITATESNLLKVPEGALVKEIIKPSGLGPNSSAAFKAGLQPGDIIVAADSEKISQNNPLEVVLQKYRPGNTIKLTVVRGKITLALSLTAQTLAGE